MDRKPETLRPWHTLQAQAVYDWLEARGMVVRNFSEHPLLPGHLRITVRTPEQNARLLAALKQWRQQSKICC